MALILFNKPFNVLCQFTPEPNGPERQTLKDYIDVPGVYPAGRLDTDSEGLLLLTTDGGFKRQMELPSTGVPRTLSCSVGNRFTECICVRPHDCTRRPNQAKTKRRI